MHFLHAEQHSHNAVALAVHYYACMSVNTYTFIIADTTYLHLSPV